MKKPVGGQEDPDDLDLECGDERQVDIVTPKSVKLEEVYGTKNTPIEFQELVLRMDNPVIYTRGVPS